jgi:dipeptidyl aminopeptidase/acylaminoacyl peptidase
MSRDDGRIVVRSSTPERPYEIFAAENNELRCLSKQTDAFLAQVSLGKVEETSFKSKDGTEVHGFLVHRLTRSQEQSCRPSFVPMVARNRVRL